MLSKYHELFTTNLTLAKNGEILEEIEDNTMPPLTFLTFLTVGSEEQCSVKVNTRIR